MGLAVLSGSNTILVADAASWYRGTPKTIQGKWQTK